MEAQDKQITQFINDKSTSFVVPTYQRKYKWTINNEIKTFLVDINEFLKDKELEYYFLGSLVVKKNSKLNSNFILVDGQQRVTTMFLLSRALFDVLGEGTLKQRVFMILETEENKFKLNRINDENIIQKILKGNISSLSEDEKKSNYYKSYMYFKDSFIKKDELELDDFFNNGIAKIKVAVINLDEKEDEFLVFESINSKGTSLTSADLIKNYIMMSLDAKNLSSSIDYFEKEFIEQLEEKELMDLFRQLLAIKTGQLYSKSSKALYYNFKHNYKKEVIDQNFVENLINELKIFEFIKGFKWPFEMLPLVKGGLMNLYSILHIVVKNNSRFENRELIIDNQDLINKSFKYLTRLLVARMLYGFGRVEGNRGYANMAKKLADEIENSNFENAFNEIVLNYLETTNRKTRMPSWDEIEKNINRTDIYSNYSALFKWVMISLEQLKINKEISYEKISVEHIFPQSPSDDWWDELTDDEINENRKFQHTLGNLSITNDNSALGNKRFERKKELLEDKSYLKINKIIYKTNKWDYSAIKERTYSLLKTIKETWW